ncbi:MAG: hypothetical protein QXZ48_05660 [Zestosphaera sp.]
MSDLSAVPSIDEYIQRMREVVKESYRVLKPGRCCAILVGDIRIRKHHVPVAFRTMQTFLEALSATLVECVLRSREQ